MNDGIYKRKGSSLSLSKLIVRVALFLSIIAVALVLFIVLTVYSSNKLMNVESDSISNVPSNVLPSYSTCSFESFDGQTNLSGWLFKCDNPISTIIVVHNTGANRLQFGVDMIDMIEMWLDNNYNVFLFDLRNSGESEGDISGYGYLEWQDVIGAIAQVKMISVTTDVILYGVGSGCTACCMAYSKLPDSNLSENELDKVDAKYRHLGSDRGYIKGMIFDSPAKNSDDYIKPIVAQKEFMGSITQNFVPYAIRISSGEDESYNLAAEISRMPIPVCVIYGGHDVFIGVEKIDQLLDERNRLNEKITSSVFIPGAGYLEAFSTDTYTYSNGILSFLHVYFG